MNEKKMETKWISVVYESGQLQKWNAKWTWKWIYFGKCNFACMQSYKMKCVIRESMEQRKTKQTDTLSKWVESNLRTLNMITKSYVGLFEFNNYNFSCLFAQKFVQGNCIRSAANDQLANESEPQNSNRIQLRIPFLRSIRDPFQL